MGKYDGMPRQVREAGEAADKAEKEWRERNQPTAAQVPGTDAPAVDTAEDGTVLTPEAAAAAATPDGEGNLIVDWEAEAKAMRTERDRATAQFSSLQGKYNSELPLARDEATRLQTELTALKAQPASVVEGTVQPAATLPDMPDGVDIKQLRADYGDAIVDAMIAMRAPNPVAAAAPAVDTTVTSRLDKLENDSTVTAEDAMYDAIAAQHKDWEAVDKLATWHKFLAEVDPNTGEKRQIALNRAHRRLDAGPIIRQLSTFKRRTKKDDSGLAAQVVPGDDGKGMPAEAADTNVYAASDIAVFYKRQAQRASQGKPVTKEDNRLDALYTKAHYEGRITN